MKLGIKPTVDVVFKKVFGSEEHSEVTASFLNAILAEAGRPRLVSLSILNPYRQGAFRGDKDAVLDVRAVDESEREFQLEVQVRPFESLPRRMLHNWATCYLARLKKGERYSCLRPVISIWILGRRLIGDGAWFHTFSFRDPVRGTELSDDALIIVIELPGWAAERADRGEHDLAAELDEWLYFLYKGDEIDPEAAPSAFRRGAIGEAIDIMRTFTKSEAAKDLYRRRMEYQSIQKEIEYEQEMALKKAQAEGLAKGLEQGLEKGLEQGREQGRVEGISEGERNRAIEDARRLKALGVNVGIIVQATGLAKDEVEDL